jgi:hypothetical protein
MNFYERTFGKWSKSVPPATVKTVQNTSKALVSTASDLFGS